MVATMSNTIRAVVSDPQASGGYKLGQVPPPELDTNQTLVRVRAVSLNRGEVGMTMQKPAGSRIGWDIAGVVEKAAADGTGPAAGSRVVGFLPACDGWAELAAAPSNYLATIPDDVGDNDAAALPVAALTALYGLERGTRLLGQKVLITGASGGVGLFACQLAKLMGAHVVAQIRRPAHEAMLKDLGVDEVVVDEDGSILAERGPYRLMFDGISGPILARCAATLTTGSTAVIYGITAHTSAEIASLPLMGAGDASIQGFNLYHEARIEAPSLGLSRLLGLVAAGRLQTLIQRTASWQEVGTVVEEFMARKFHGKAILTID